MNENRIQHKAAVGIALEYKTPKGFIKKVYVPVTLKPRVFKKILKETIKALSGVLLGIFAAVAVPERYILIIAAISAGVYMAERIIRKIGKT